MEASLCCLIHMTQKARFVQVIAVEVMSDDGMMLLA